MYGSTSGLSSAGNQQWDQNTPGVKHTSIADADFGLALAARDFNSDGYTDLAIGVPGEPHHGFSDVGAVSVLYGSSAGLTADGNQYISGQLKGRFGSSLAAGIFDGAGGQDLGVGAPDGSNGLSEAGNVYWLSGTSKGLKNLQAVPNAHAPRELIAARP